MQSNTINILCFAAEGKNGSTPINREVGDCNKTLLRSKTIVVLSEGTTLQAMILVDYY